MSFNVNPNVNVVIKMSGLVVTFDCSNPTLHCTALTALSEILTLMVLLDLLWII